MSKIECKYKFQDKYHFEGKPYCTCFDKQCSDLNFICDANCQVYEDQKKYEEIKKYAGQILRTNYSLTQINENLFGTLKQIKNACKEVYTKTNEAKQLKNLIIEITKKVLND